MTDLFSCPANGLSICLDWLSFTFDTIYSISDVKDFLNFSETELQYFDSGSSGYRKRYKHKSHSISLLFDGSENMGVHLTVTGSAIEFFLCDFLESHYEITPFGDGFDFSLGSKLSYFFKLMNEKGHFSRIDIAIDDVGQNYYSMLDLHRFNEMGLYISKSRQWKEVVETETPTSGFLPGSYTGYTIYIGSRSSDTFIRIYDKKLEQNKKLKAQGLPLIKEKWVRWELEIKGNNCRNLSMLFSSGEKNIKEIALGVLSNYIRFIKHDNKRKDRCSTDDIWNKFLDGVSSCRIGFSSSLMDCLERKKYWLFRTCSRALYDVFSSENEDFGFLEDLLTVGELRSYSKS